MDKQTIIKMFDGDERTEVMNLYEKLMLSKERDIPLFGNNFYTPNVWKFFVENFNSKEFSVTVSGFFEDAERRMIAFNNLYDIAYPYKVIKILNCSKFNALSHRDYLGALLALGIKRNKVGDLLVKDNFCYIPVYEEIEEFVMNNLTSIGKNPCTIEIMEEDFVPPKIVFEEIIILVQSLRIDSIISKLAKVSRGNAQKIIDQGKILVDYNEVNSKSEEIESGSRITIRGIGKFILGDIIGNSKSGKYKVMVKKYT